MAKPTRAGSSPPGRRAASRANTGRTMNSPSMRKANTSAKEALARRSAGVMRAASGGGASAVAAGVGLREGTGAGLGGAQAGGVRIVGEWHVAAGRWARRPLAAYHARLPSKHPKRLEPEL